MNVWNYMLSQPNIPNINDNKYMLIVSSVELKKKVKNAIRKAHLKKKALSLTSSQ